MPHHIDLLHAIDEEPELRAIVRRLARVHRAGRLADFLELVRSDPGLNLETRKWLLRVARNEPFLAAVDAYYAGQPAARGTQLQSALAGAISSVG
jgi:hypothetical protein